MLICPVILNLSGAETRIFQDELVKTFAAYALAPHVARPSTAMVLTMQHKQVLFFHEEIFQLPVLPDC